MGEVGFWSAVAACTLSSVVGSFISGIRYRWFRRRHGVTIHDEWLANDAQFLVEVSRAVFDSAARNDRAGKWDVGGER